MGNSAKDSARELSIASSPISRSELSHYFPEILEDTFPGTVVHYSKNGSPLETDYVNGEFQIFTPDEDRYKEACRKFSDILENIEVGRKVETPFGEINPQMVGGSTIGFCIGDKTYIVKPHELKEDYTTAATNIVNRNLHLLQQ